MKADHKKKIRNLVSDALFLALDKPHSAGNGIARNPWNVAQSDDVLYGMLEADFMFSPSALKEVIESLKARAG